ncbi:MAG: hypothetical protein WA269_09440, partial [Candidatus Udaeobacter sp.]
MRRVNRTYSRSTLARRTRLRGSFGVAGSEAATGAMDEALASAEDAVLAWLEFLVVVSPLERRWPSPSE